METELLKLEKNVTITIKLMEMVVQLPVGLKMIISAKEVLQFVKRSQETTECHSQGMF